MVLGKLIGAVVIIVIVLIGVSFLSQAVIDLTTAGQGLLDAFRINITPQSGEEVCDLSVTVFGELRGSVIERATVRLGSDTEAGTAKRYQWLTPCHPSTQIPLFSLLDNNQVGVGNLAEVTQTLGLLTLGDTFEVQIVLVDASGQRRASDIKYINLPAGFIGTPRDMQQTFILANMPDRNYDLEIFYRHNDVAIEGLPFGAPFKDRVCKMGLTTC